jgi:hypothetical protein
MSNQVRPPSCDTDNPVADKAHADASSTPAISGPLLVAGAAVLVVGIDDEVAGTRGDDRFTRVSVVKPAISRTLRLARATLVDRTCVTSYETYRRPSTPAACNCVR